jgi:hypothetical protein
MSKYLTALALLLSAALCRLEAIDLTPHEISAADSNTPLAAKRYFFLDGNKRMGFRIDNKMSVFGGGESVYFRFSDLPASAMKISHSQFNSTIPFTDKSLETYRQAAHALIDTKATGLQIEDRPNPISINQWTSYQFVFAYNLSGATYRRSITFLNYGENEQLTLDVVGAEHDYQKTYTRGYNVLNSLSDLPANQDGTGPT